MAQKHVQDHNEATSNVRYEDGAFNTLAGAGDVPQLRTFKQAAAVIVEKVKLANENAGGEIAAADVVYADLKATVTAPAAGSQDQGKVVLRLKDGYTSNYIIDDQNTADALEFSYAPISLREVLFDVIGFKERYQEGDEATVVEAVEAALPEGLAVNYDEQLQTLTVTVEAQPTEFTLDDTVALASALISSGDSVTIKFFDAPVNLAEVLPNRALTITAADLVA